MIWKRAQMKDNQLIWTNQVLAACRTRDDVLPSWRNGLYTSKEFDHLIRRFGRLLVILASNILIHLILLKNKIIYKFYVPSRVPCGWIDAWAVGALGNSIMNTSLYKQVPCPHIPRFEQCAQAFTNRCYNIQDI